jgi:hypothetical protein
MYSTEGTDKLSIGAVRILWTITLEVPLHIPKS